MFSHTSVILSTIGLMAIRSLLILVTARSVRILLECFLVMNKTNEDAVSNKTENLILAIVVL